MRYLSGEQSGVAGGPLFVQSWQPDGDARGVIVLVHGLAEHSGRYDELVRRQVALRRAVYALDLPGHGRSSGARARIDRFDAVVGDVAARIATARREQPGRPVALLGHSMGGALALATALAHPDALQALVLSAPAVGADPNVPRARVLLARALARLAPSVGLLRLPARALSRDPIVVRGYENDPLVYHGSIPARTLVELIDAMPRLLAAAPALGVPVLAMHGTDDALVPLRYVEPVYARLGSPDATVLRYEGLYHEIFNEPERGRVHADLEAWLEARC